MAWHVLESMLLLMLKNNNTHWHTLFKSKELYTKYWPWPICSMSQRLSSRFEFWFWVVHFSTAQEQKAQCCKWRPRNLRSLRSTAQILRFWGMHIGYRVDFNHRLRLQRFNVHGLNRVTAVAVRLTILPRVRNFMNYVTIGALYSFFLQCWSFCLQSHGKKEGVRVLTVFTTRAWWCRAFRFQGLIRLNLVNFKFQQQLLQWQGRMRSPSHCCWWWHFWWQNWVTTCTRSDAGEAAAVIEIL